MAGSMYRCRSRLVVGYAGEVDRQETSEKRE